ncbi:cholesterol 7-desaturase nvd-like [Physella acuta]|uniref:cholesterol 7-desaturase nvd-like n=1 Tax=Physella acuta TaxID=109671 RepID=UPI0027DAB879|nr:cholesterol 7-desaturase nvd-like [Physella acuta]
MGSEINDDKLYMPVPEIRLSDLLDWKNVNDRNHRRKVQVEKNNDFKSQPNNTRMHNKCFGNQIQLNDENIALFRIGQKVYATQATCPHAGGPLHLADIEELLTGEICLKCPWHKWQFSIHDGRTIYPLGHLIKAKTFPVKVDKDGKLFVGFDSFGPSAFSMDF